MAFVIKDRVKETSTTTGTGTLTLAGAETGYQAFSVIGNSNTTFYGIEHQSASEWEVGIGTYTSSGTTLARTTVISSSNSGSAVDLSAGTKNVFVTLPAQNRGTVLQVVQATKTDSFSSTSTSYVDLTDMTASITPISSTSKVLIHSNLALSNNDDVNHCYALLLRGTTEIIKGDAGGSRTRATMVVSQTGTGQHLPRNFVYLDSPSTTSSTTYKWQAKASASNGFYLNRSMRDNDGAGYDGRSCSTMVLYEISE